MGYKNYLQSNIGTFFMKLKLCPYINQNSIIIKWSPRTTEQSFNDP